MLRIKYLTRANLSSREYYMRVGRLEGPWELGSDDGVAGAERGPAARGVTHQKYLKMICKRIRDGEPLRIEDACICHLRMLQALEVDVMNEKFVPWRAVEIGVVWGATGVGKTMWAFRAFGHERVYRLAFGARCAWTFSGYAGQEVLLIDVFTSYISYRCVCVFFCLCCMYTSDVFCSSLLVILNEYARRSIKGTRVSALYTKVIITSSKPVHEWYSRGRGLTTAQLASLERRISWTEHLTVELNFSNGCPRLPAREAWLLSQLPAPAPAPDASEDAAASSNANCSE